MPMIKEIATEAIIMEIVIIISSQKPNVPIRNIKILKVIPHKIDLKYHPNANIIKINSHHGSQTKKSSIPLIIQDAIKKIKSKKPSKVVANQLIKSSTYFPIDVVSSGNSFISSHCYSQHSHPSCFVKL